MLSTLEQILDAREKRAQRQQALLQQFGCPLLCFTMNIPGPEKVTPESVAGFYIGNWLLENALDGCKILHRETRQTPGGCEALYAVEIPSAALKERAVALEETKPIGRLFDMDVLDTNGSRLSRETLGLPRRKCLICGADAVLCARSRAHALPELRARTDALLRQAAHQYIPSYIAQKAHLALRQEVFTTPKPGLVDTDNTGAHKDMDLSLFLASADALRPYFREFARQGLLTDDAPPEVTFAKIRPVGIAAEKAMLKATGGVNTHKGAIFSLGLVCAAAGRLHPTAWQPECIAKECAAMTNGLVARDFANVTVETSKTAGERLYALYGITGVRGQAEAGFPAVLETGLPILKAGLEEGLCDNDARSVALLHLICAADDTNLIHRGDRQTQLRIRHRLSALLEKDPFPKKDVIRQLDSQFTARNLSPGGSADLLSVTCLLYLLENAGG